MERNGKERLNSITPVQVGTWEAARFHSHLNCVKSIPRVMWDSIILFSLGYPNVEGIKV